METGQNANASEARSRPVTRKWTAAEMSGSAVSCGHWSTATLSRRSFFTDLGSHYDGRRFTPTLRAIPTPGFRLPALYSARKASIGSTLVARRAGTHAEQAVITNTIAALTMYSDGLSGPTPST